MALKYCGGTIANTVRVFTATLTVSSVVQKIGIKTCNKALFHIKHTCLRIIYVMVYLVLLYSSLVCHHRGSAEGRLDCESRLRFPEKPVAVQNLQKTIQCML